MAELPIHCWSYLQTCMSKSSQQTYIKIIDKPLQFVSVIFFLVIPIIKFTANNLEIIPSQLQKSPKRQDIIGLNNPATAPPSTPLSTTHDFPSCFHQQTGVGGRTIKTEV